MVRAAGLYPVLTSDKCKVAGSNPASPTNKTMWFKIVADYGNIKRLQFWLWAENREALDELVAKKKKEKKNIKKVYSIEEGLTPSFLS